MRHVQKRTTQISNTQVLFLGGVEHENVALVVRAGGTVTQPIVFSSYGTGAATLKANTYGNSIINVSNCGGIEIASLVLVGPGPYRAVAPGLSL